MRLIQLLKARKTAPLLLEISKKRKKKQPKKEREKRKKTFQKKTQIKQ
jgi:hypothetical protein